MNMMKNALTNLKGHKLRVFITLVWIIIGITSVILVSSIGNGVKKEVLKSVSKVNPNKTQIYFEPTNSNMAGMTSFLSPFKLKDLEELSFLEGVEKIGPAKDDFAMNSMFYSEAYFDKKATYVDVSPLKDDTTLNPLYGRSFSYEDENRKVIIITLQNATDLFGTPQDALGKGISINGNIYEVIGVIDESSVVKKEKEESNSFESMYYGDMDYLTSYMPKKALDTLINQNMYPTDINQLDLVVSNGYDLFETASRVTEKLHELHPDIEGTYQVHDPSEQTQALESMVNNINMFITVITAISMFVGGVGVMNIMYISVMERQREIGIRRAIGAKPRDIMLQFLTESVFITVLGGILGIIIGFIVVNYASSYLPFKAIVNVNSLFYAFVATIVTGVIFGIVPAFKASRLDPIKAIYK